MPASSDSQVLSIILDKLDDIQQDNKKALERMTRTEVTLDDHKKTKGIHQNPPCEMAKSLNTKIWAALVIAVLSLGSVLWKVLSAKVLP